MIIVGVYDKLAQEVSMIHSCANEEVAVREFRSGIDSRSLIAMNPKDYQLVKLANIDVRTGDITECAVTILKEAELVVSETN